MRRFVLGLCLMVGLGACVDATQDLAQPVEPLGDFKLGFAEVVAPNLEKMLVSRDATPEEWSAVVDRAMETRFGRFSGTRTYHFGISVEAYSLPPPVVPGKSALAMRVTVWDDAEARKLNSETELITVIKVFESRLTKDRDTQMRQLAEEAALMVENWLREQQSTRGWFQSGAPDAEEVETSSDSAPLSAGSDGAPQANQDG